MNSDTVKRLEFGNSSFLNKEHVKQIKKIHNLAQQLIFILNQQNYS